MVDIFFSADTHIDHGGIFIDKDTGEVVRRGALRFRPQFCDLDEMNETIIERWNSVVGKHDIVWHLGDFGFKIKRFRYWLSRLNGSIHLILGNHDPDWPATKIKDVGFASIRQAHYLKIGEDKVYLHHYACRTWRSSYRGSYHLYGHSHGDIEDFNRSTDVGVDAWDFYPVPWSMVKERLKDRPITNHH